METIDTTAVARNEKMAGRKPSYSRQCYDHIIRQIFAGALKPGDEINRKAVAIELGISLAPVGEAINQLQSDGFLEIAPRRQTRVRIISKEEVRGLLIMREAMECQAARLYCGDKVKNQMNTLLPLARAVDASQAETRENEMAEAAFHQALVDLVECPLLSEEFQKIMRRRVFMKINIIVPWNVQPPLDSHVKLLQQLSAPDPCAAEAAMRQHLERGRERIIK